jgi:hypothetical protein
MPRDFTVVALIAAYNEADILPAVIQALIAEGVNVYLLDHGSTDGTRQAAEPFLGKGLLAIEPFPGDRFPDARNAFAWTSILERKRELSMELDADWFIHHDADEFRESIWEGLPLSDAVRRVDRLGYNAIDFEVFNFWPTNDEFVPGGDPRPVLRHHAPGGPWDKIQVKCWKKMGTLPDLASSGGHDVMFPGRRVFPLRFLLRHYPVRSQAHGERKVLIDRRPRFVEQERERGWHLQYDAFDAGTRFVRSPDSLTEFDPVEARLHALAHHRGVDDLTARLDHLARRLAVREDGLRALQSELEPLHENLKHARARATEDERDIIGLRTQIAHLEADVDAHRLEVGRLEHEVEALHASKSWRWMAPLRAIHRLVHRP